MDYTEQFIRLELQLDVGLQNDEAECRNEMHGNRIIYSNDIVPEKATGIQTRFSTNWICWLNNGGYSGRSAASH